MEAISRSCLPEAAARTKRQRKATCCGVLGAASHRTTCARSSAAKLTSGLILAMRTHISYWPQYVYLFMIHTTRKELWLYRNRDPYACLGHRRNDCDLLRRRQCSAQSPP